MVGDEWVWTVSMPVLWMALAILTCSLVLTVTSAFTVCLLSRNRLASSTADDVSSSSSLRIQVSSPEHGTVEGNMQRGHEASPSSRTKVCSDMDNLLLTPETKGPDEAFLCPITQDVFQDPVVASDGFSYERNALTLWRKLKPLEPEC